MVCNAEQVIVNHGV